MISRKERGIKPSRRRSGFALIAIVALAVAALYAAWDAPPASASDAARVAARTKMAAQAQMQIAAEPTGVPVSATVTPDIGAQPTYPPPPPTAFQTPSPGADGAILYVVLPGDTLWRIASITGVSVDQLRSLNGLTSDVLSVGQRLIVVKGPAATAGAAVTAGAPPAATGTAAPNPPTAGANQAPSTNHSLVGTGTVCALVWSDADGDGVRDSGESLLRSEQVTVIAIITGQTVQAYTTDGANEPHCFNDLPAGQYTVSAVAPAGYTATTVTSVPLEVRAGSVTTLEFGAQQQAALPGGPRPPTRSQPAMTGLLFGGSAILILLALLAVAGGAIFLFWRRAR